MNKSLKDTTTQILMVSASAIIVACTQISCSKDSFLMKEAQKSVSGIKTGFNEAFDPQQAVADYQKKAAQGDVEAQYKLAKCYAAGKGITQDFTLAVKYFSMAAEKGHIQAQADLAECYLHGKGVQKDEEKAISMYGKLATNNARKENEVSKLAQNRLIDILYSTSNPSNRLKGILRSLSRKNENIAFALGNWYLERNNNRGLATIIHNQVKSADLQYQIGTIYNQYGYTDLAARYFRRAARQGHEEAKNKIAKKNQKKATAQAQQVSNVSRAPATSSNNSEVKHSKQDVEEMLKLLMWGAEQGDANSQFFLGEAYLDGNDVSKDYKKGVYWLRKAAAQGHEDAIKRLKQIGELK